MSLQRVAWNAVANTTGMMINMLTGLLVMPFLIQELGASTYGLWSLVGSLTGYLGVLDFGVRPAVGRLVAAYRARGELRHINELTSTATVLLIVVGVMVVLATLLAVELFPLIFSVPPADASDVRCSLGLIGMTVAVSFPSSVFDGLLWGYERFDLLSVVDAISVLFRTILIFALVRDSCPLTTLASIILTLNICSGAVKAFLCYRVERDFHLSISQFNKRNVTEIYSYGPWISLITWSKTLTPQVVLAIVGHAVGTVAVTSFSVGRQLVSYSDILTNVATQVMAPKAIAAHALRAFEAQRTLLVKGSQFALALALYFSGGLFCLGLPFIHRWLHGTQDGSYRLMLILLLGQILPMSQWLTYSILVGSHKHRLVGLLAASEFVAVSALAAVCVKFAGLAGICAAVACASFAIRGVLQMTAGCRLINMTVLEYARQAFLPVTMAAIPPITLLWMWTALVTPTTFTSMGASGLGYSIIFAFVMGVALLGVSGFTSAARLVLPRFARLR